MWFCKIHFCGLFWLGEVSDSGSGGSDSDSSDISQEEFNDGYDDNLMGDEEDQKRLAQMTEKEREQEIFKRVERREIMRTRFAFIFLIVNFLVLFLVLAKASICGIPTFSNEIID